MNSRMNYIYKKLFLIHMINSLNFCFGLGAALRAKAAKIKGISPALKEPSLVTAAQAL